MLTDIELVRAHLNIDPSYKGDDPYIYSLISAAEDLTAKRLGVKSLNDLLIDGARLPESVSHAILIMIGQWYANREATVYGSVSELPLSYEYIAALNKNYKTTF